jgi:hypothetical protein
VSVLCRTIDVDTKRLMVLVHAVTPILALGHPERPALLGTVFFVSIGCLEHRLTRENRPR